MSVAVKKLRSSEIHTHNLNSQETVIVGRATPMSTRHDIQMVYNELFDQIRKYKAPPHVGCMNILVAGAVGCGKSSFICSTDSLFNRYLSRCAPHGTRSSSLTRKLRRYKFQGPDGVIPEFALWDTMGWAPSYRNTSELMLIMEGYAPNGTNLEGGINIRDRARFTLNATLKDKMHSVLFVVDLDNATNDECTRQLSELKDVVFENEMQPLILLTKIDEHLENMMDFEKIEEAKKAVSNATGVPKSCILPIKNFQQEMDIEAEAGLLLLQALKEAINTATTFVANQQTIDP